MTIATLNTIFSRTSGHCHFCGDPLVFSRRGMKKRRAENGAWEVDHVIQKHKGGKNAVENCLAACIRCNRLRWHRKGANLRELLLLGLIAKGEIQKGTSTGQHLRDLVVKRAATNKCRRLRKEALSK